MQRENCPQRNNEKNQEEKLLAETELFLLHKIKGRLFGSAATCSAAKESLKQQQW